MPENEDLTPGHQSKRPVSRRRLLTSAAGLGAAGVVGVAAGSALQGTDKPSGLEPVANLFQAIEPFDGPHQAGIATPRPGNIVLAAFDVTSQTLTQVSYLFQIWTEAIRSLAAGHLVDPGDSGETVGLPASDLTVTVGVGPSLFDSRFGLDRKKPPALHPLPTFPSDRIDETLSDGDIVVQACAEGEIVATHAIRQLARIGSSMARLRWVTTGYAPSPAALAGTTPRNPLGFKDGIANADLGSPQFNSTVWVRRNPPWLTHGTYLCYRKIRINTASWDNLTVADQQVVIGRSKLSGAPLSGGSERTPLNLAARASDGQLAIPEDSHVRLASPQVNNDAALFRRSYAYEDGVALSGDVVETGLLFLAFNADPNAQFIPILTRLSKTDRLNQFTTHIASGIWAMLPAPIASAGWLAESLLG